MTRKLSIFLVLFLCLKVNAYASDNTTPNHKKPSALYIAQQAFLVLRAQLPKNAISKKSKGKISRLINRHSGKRARVNQFETYINNDYQDTIIKQKQLAIFRSGKLKGTGILITQYVEDTRSPLLQIWLPKLRKVRRFSAPQADEFWNGSNLTYGEVFLRKLSDETHTLLTTSIFNDCLSTLSIPQEEQTRYTKNLPQAQCSHKGKAIYQLKSTTHLPNWWYDYHISFIDTSSFAIYRTQYYKNDTLIKTVDIDWQSLNQKDPRAVYPAYLYSKSEINQSESLFIVPRETVAWNTKTKANFIETAWQVDQLLRKRCQQKTGRQCRTVRQISKESNHERF